MSCGWFPRFSPDGQHLAAGSGTLEIDGVAVGPGYQPEWGDEQHVIVYQDGLAPLLVYGLDGSRIELTRAVEVNAISGGGMAWARWTATTQTITRDTGETVTGRCPAVCGERFAYLSVAGFAVQVDDRTFTALEEMRGLRACEFGVTWIQGGHVHGMAWDGTPGRITPGWRSCLEARPVQGPDGQYLLAVEQINADLCRLVLAQWGTHQGYLVAVGDIRNADAVWDGQRWRFAWGNGQGVLHVYDSPLDVAIDLLADQPPPPPQPTVSIISAEPTQGIVPFSCTAQAEALNATMTRWLRNGVIEQPVTEQFTLTHEYQIAEPGLTELAVRAAGPGGITTSRVTLVTGLATPAPTYPEGFLLLQGGAYAEVLPTLRGFGWQGCRVDTGTTWGSAQAVLGAGLRPLIICRSLPNLNAVPEYTDVDWHNEPDGQVDRYFTPAQYLATLPDAMAICQRRHLRLWVGSISNLSRPALDWLAAIMPSVPLDVGVSPHRYPHGFGMKFETPHPGFASRAAEVVALKAIIGPRRWGIGEVGYHQARETGGALCWKKSSRLGDEEIRQRMQQEFAFWRVQGAAFCAWYQFTDGLTDTRGDRYGIRRADGTWKAWARVA